MTVAQIARPGIQVSSQSMDGETGSKLTDLAKGGPAGM